MTSESLWRTVAILERLVAFDTVSAKSNLALIGWIEDLLREEGVTFRRIPDPVLDKAALWVTVGPAGRPGYILSAHTDVVPVEGQAWASDPFVLTRRGGKLYGRGATDMKGFLAVCLAMLPAMRSARLETPIHLAISYDEEVGCTGVRPMLTELAQETVKPLGCFVGEPTSMGVVIGHKGKRGIRVTVRGRACHSALAPHGVNAVEWATELVQAVREIAREQAERGPRDPLYEVPFSTALTTMIEGGIATNIVPERCAIELEFRAVGPENSGVLADSFIAGPGAMIDAQLRAVDPACGVDFETTIDYVGLDTAPEHALVTLAKQIAGRNEHSKVAFGTEAGLFTSMAGIPAVVIGPGNIEQAHKPDEWVDEGELSACIAFVERLIGHCSG